MSPEPSAPPAPAPKGPSNLALRLLSAAVLLPIAIACFIVGGWWLKGLALIAEESREFKALKIKRHPQILGLDHTNTPLAAVISYAPPDLIAEPYGSFADTIAAGQTLHNGAALLYGLQTSIDRYRHADAAAALIAAEPTMKFPGVDEFLKKYPDAPAACIEAREYNGKRYAKFNAKVYLNSADRTTVTLQDPAGKDLSTFSFRPAPGAAVKINGKDTRFTDLRTGEVISFWVSEDRMTASALPESTGESWAVLPPLP